ncbi:AmmeMemoRadiSam system protein B, partial [bacterium]|nr:AmmeMemoRadiSam system protein B [bacterium]
PDDAHNLADLLDSYKEKNEINTKSKAIIVPHAGYVFSGHAAMAGFSHLDANENIFIIAPSHHYVFSDIAMPEYTFFDTPLGSIEVNNRIIKEIAEKYPSIITNDFFENEHAIEVQLPFLQNIFFPQKQSAVEFMKNLKKLGKKLRIVPILTGRCDYRMISDIISDYYETSSFIISSDLSHYYTQEQCRQIDTYTASLIENGKTESFEQAQACGLSGIMGLVDFASKNGYSMIRAEMYNSGDISEDKSRVVGYGSWYLYEGSKNDYISNNYSKYLIETAKSSILSEINGEQYEPECVPSALHELGASFVTIKKEGALRGCIGSIYPTRPLILDVIDNAKNAAFQDPRFNPLSAEEWNNIDISISLLSAPERIKFKDEKDLLSKIYPYGIILIERSRRAVYLPVVWEQLPDREIFLNSLKEKAGLPPNYFSPYLEAYRFDAMYISEETINS